MDSVTLSAFEDEITKIASLRDLVRRFKDLFRSDEERVLRRVDYFFSNKAGKDKWDKLVQHSRDQKFVDLVLSSPLTDDKLREHVQAMGSMMRGKTVGKVYSESEPGKTYEIRKGDDGQLSCQCADWRYHRSVSRNRDCKHIEAFKEGRFRVA